MFQESRSQTFWFPPGWGLPANGAHVVTQFYLVGASVSAKQLQAGAQQVTYSL